MHAISHKSFLNNYATQLLAGPYSRGCGGVRRTTPSLPKGPPFATKWPKMGFYEVQKVHFLGFRTPLKSSLATGLTSGTKISIRKKGWG